MRLFVAIELPERIRERIVKVQRELQGLGGVSWVRGENLHLTLKFLGNVKEDRLKEVKGVVERVALSSSPFSLNIRGVGCFPTLKRPRVVWVGVENHTPLYDLQRELEEAFEGIGFEREKRPFHPHITFGRIKKIPDERWTERLLSFREEEMGRMEVTSISLFSSTLRPTGAVYTCLLEAALGGGKTCMGGKG